MNGAGRIKNGLVDMGLKIGEIARRSGIPISTIRFYVKEGLLPPPEKVNKKMAYYDEGCIKKLQAIQHLKEKKYYPLAIIKNILRRMDDGFTFEEAVVVEDTLFDPMSSAEAGVVDRVEFLRLTGLTPEQLEEVERIGLLMPYFREHGKILYNQDDVIIAREAIRQVYRFGLDPMDFGFYLRLGHEITDQEVSLRRKITRGLSAKENIEITTYLTRAVNLFRGYILRRLLQQKIQTRIQKSLGRTKKDPKAG
ncbi:MAG: MerR family transcriptional regulator [Desulfobacterota bacterium]|nr:MerR family transcriptional regulator [Thermodesulfobacteriota bacterium]